MFDWKEYVRERLALGSLQRAREERIIEELADQLAEFYRDAKARGATDSEAEAFATNQVKDWTCFESDIRRAERPNTKPKIEQWHDRAAEAGHKQGGLFTMMTDFRQDVLYGLRMLRRNPGFTAVAVLTLALGIGANTAIFSVVNSVVLKPLPFEEPEQLVYVYEAYPEKNFFKGWHSAPLFYDWRDRNEVFSQISAVWQKSYTLTGMGEPVSVTAASVPSEFFPLFRFNPLLGRSFGPEEEVAGKDQVAVISYGLWQERFGGDGEIIGKSVTLTGKPYTIIGVLASRQEFPRSVKLWTPFVVPEDQNRRGYKFMYSVARIKPGVTLEQARANMTAVAKSLAKDYPDNYSEGFDSGVFSMQEEIVGKTGEALWLLLGVVSLVLLIACANIANLLLARAASREKEVAIRMASGAGPGRLLRQLLTESVLLASLGGALGLLLAWGGVQLFIAFSPQRFPRMDELGVDWQVLSYALGLSLLTGIVFGLVPALRSIQPDLTQALKEGTRTGGGGFSLFRHHRLRNLLVIGEVAMAMVLLMGAGLLIRSFATLLSQETGFDPSRVLTMQVSLPGYKYSTPDQQNQFFEQLLERTATLRGVEHAAAINALPFGNSQWVWSFETDRTDSDGKTIKGSADYRITTPEYFGALGIPLLRGRTFSAGDRKGTPGAFIVNETFVKKYFPKGNTLGVQIRLSEKNEWSSIVGVVGNVRHEGLDSELRPEMYRAFAQHPTLGMTLVVRAGSQPAALVKTLRGFVRDIDPDLPLGKISTMEGLISNSVAQPRFYMVLLALFAGIAVLLAAVGIYGVMAYSVSQRTHEIGIRMALGAQQSDVLTLVLLQGGLLAGIGIIAGLGGAYALTHYMKSLLYEITPTDPVTFAAVALLLLAMALLACYIPARRATKVDPMVALRYE